MNALSQKVSMAEKIGYSLGDCSANLVFQMMMIYQTKFYTDVFGLEGAIAGSVMLIARIVDAFVDPTVGILSDRTQTKWGKYRPWVLWTALPFMMFYVLAFYNPGIEDKGLVAVYATISYTLLMTLYSFNNTPYASLGGVMSSDIKERTSITSIRFVAATIAQFVVQGLTLPLVSKFAGESGDKGHGWLCTISLFAVIGFVFLVITFFSSRERITPPANQKTDTRKDIKDVFKNIPWRAMFILTLFLFTTLAMWGSAMNYYFENYVDSGALFAFLDKLGLVATQASDSVDYTILNAFGLIVSSPEKAYEVGFGVFNMLGAVVQFFGVIFLSGFLANRFGKKSVFIVCLTLTALFTAFFYFPNETDVETMFVLNFLKSLAYASHRSTALGYDCRRSGSFGICQSPPCNGFRVCRCGVCTESRIGYRWRNFGFPALRFRLYIRRRDCTKRIGYSWYRAFIQYYSGCYVLYRCHSTVLLPYYQEV